MVSSPSRARRFRNWAGTEHCTPVGFLTPGSEAELGEQLVRAGRQGRRVKVVGAGHSWSDIACTDGYQLSLDRLCRVVRTRPIANADGSEDLELTVEAGLRLKHLVRVLRSYGYTLPLTGSVLEQSIAGAISTGTHGSAPRLGNLSTLLTRLRLVLADGSVRTASRDENPELFAAARVGLGALGVITEVSLRAVPARNLREVATPQPIAEVLAELPAIIESAPFVKLWWMPHTTHVVVYRASPSAEPSTLSRFGRWVEEAILNRRLFTAALTASKHAPAIIPHVNRAIGAAYFRPQVRVGPLAEILPVPMPPLHDEIEYAIPIERSADALAFVHQLIEREGLRVNFPVEVRFVAADDAWLSPMYGRATCCFGAYMATSASLPRYFEAVETELLGMGGRPHWGKRFGAAVGARYLRTVYPEFQRFRALRDQLDPDRRFDNAFLQKVLDS